MHFLVDPNNPDPNKHAQEIIFSRKRTFSIHPVVYFDNTRINSTRTHKHVGVILDSKLGYEHHFQSFFSRINKIISLLRKL